MFYYCNVRWKELVLRSKYFTEVWLTLLILNSSFQYIDKHFAIYCNQMAILVFFMFTKNVILISFSNLFKMNVGTIIHLYSTSSKVILLHKFDWAHLIKCVCRICKLNEIKLRSQVSCYRLSSNLSVLSCIINSDTLAHNEFPHITR